MKTIWKISLYLLTAFLLLSASHKPDYCKMSDLIIKKYIQEFANPRGFYLSSTGGAMMDNIQKIHIGFSSFHRLNVDDARRLYVEMMEELLNRINEDQLIRPYLANYPFEERNIKLQLNFNDTNGKILADGHVALMFIVKDHVFYSAAYNPQEKKFYDLNKEDYREALKKAKGVEYEICLEN